MFSYTMPCGGFKTITIKNGLAIKFEPPVFEQRYCAVVQILQDERWTRKLKKVADFGCAEMKLVHLLRRCENIENILQIDIDEELLKNKKERVNPLCADFLKKRECPLQIDVLQGSAADYSNELLNTDAVIALELIEHVYDDVLCKIPINIFGNIQPKLAVISTPNADFNKLFNLPENSFRHEDHKFEWTREQFKNWCENIIAEFPDYNYALMGVGDPPPGYEHLGNVTQIGIFVRKDILDSTLEPYKHKPVADVSAYKLLHSVNYPHYVDKRSVEEKVTDEINYQINKYMFTYKYYNEFEDIHMIPLSAIVFFTESIGGNTQFVRNILYKKDFKVENGKIIVDSNEKRYDDLQDDHHRAYDEQLENDNYNEINIEMDIDEDWDNIS